MYGRWRWSSIRRPGPASIPELAARLLGLSPMESRVAVAVATGQTVAGIAAALNCGESTVKTHLKRVYRKLGVRKQTELVRRILALEGVEAGPSRETEAPLGRSSEPVDTRRANVP